MNREHCQLLEAAQFEVRKAMTYYGAAFENDEVGLDCALHYFESDFIISSPTAAFENDEVGLEIMKRAVVFKSKQGVGKAWAKESRYCARVILLYHLKMKDAGYEGSGLLETIIARCVKIRVNELTS